MYNSYILFNTRTSTSVAILAQVLLKSFWLKSCVMESGSDGITGRRALDWEAPGEDAITGSSRPVALAGRGAGGSRVRAPRVPPRKGSFNAWLVGVDGEGPFGVHPEASRDANPQTHAIAATAACEWEFVEPTNENMIAHLEMHSGEKATASEPWGFVQYRIVDVNWLHEPTMVPDIVCPGPFDAMTPLHFAQAAGDEPLRPSGLTVRGWIHEVGGSVATILLFSLSWLSSLDVCTLPRLFHSVHLSLRVNPRALVPQFPTASVLKMLRGARRVRRNQGGGRAAAASRKRSYDDVLLELPKRHRGEKQEPDHVYGARVHRRMETDPLRIINAVFLPAPTGCQKYELGIGRCERVRREQQRKGRRRPRCNQR